jgi:hypothetical protein
VVHEFDDHTCNDPSEAPAKMLGSFIAKLTRMLHLLLNKPVLPLILFSETVHILKCFIPIVTNVYSLIHFRAVMKLGPPFYEHMSFSVFMSNR